LREHSAATEVGEDGWKAVERPAHPSNPVVAQLNARWRVVDDGLWVLQRRKGNPRRKNSGWVGSAFCGTKDALLRNILERCGPVDPSALTKLIALPDYHGKQNLDVRRTGQAQADKPTKPWTSRTLELSNAGK